MSFVPDNDVKDRVKQATDVVRLIGSQMALQRKGAIYVGHCPWHQDTRPSFQVNPNKQTWVCWPCNLRGDVFDYVMRYENVDFRQALEILAEEANIPLSKGRGQKIIKGSPNDKQTLYRAMKWAEEEYHQCLLNSDAAIPIREYLSERGITAESIDQFRVGFAPLSWSWLVDRARNSEFSPEILEACGLVSANQNGGWYERFRGRVLFPIRDTQNRPIAIGGRVVPSLYGEGEEIPPAKYVNSPETRLFSKSQNLYALNLANEQLRLTPREQVKSLTVVEGYTDVIAAHQNGLKNVVAALGVALNDQHLSLIKRFADSITLVLDGDDAGQRTMNNVLDLFVAQDIDLRILSLPEGLDPFDFVMANGGQPFQDLVDAAPDAIAHKILTETRGIDLVNDTHRANQALESILKTLAKIPAKLIRESAAKSMRQEQIVMRLARQFQLAPDQVRRRLTELRTAVRPQFASTEEESGGIDVGKFKFAEVSLIQLLILDPSLLDKAVENVSPSQFQPGVLRDLYEVLDECFHEGRDVGYEQLMLELEDPKLKGLVDYLYDEAIEKKNALDEGSSFDFGLEEQLETVIDKFNEPMKASDSIAKISKLQTKQLNEAEEASTLEALFQQELQKLKKTK